MKFSTNSRMFVWFLGLALLIPAQASASVIITAPEPLSLALLATGLAGLGAAEVIRRRRGK